MRLERWEGQLRRKVRLGLKIQMGAGLTIRAGVMKEHWSGGEQRQEGRLLSGVPPFVAASQRSSGERRLANRNQQVVVRLRGQYVVLLVQPGKLCFEIAYSLLQAAHL